MSSADFNIDSLLDDINDADFLTPRGGCDYSSSKHVPHPPKSEKSHVQVFSTNPKSKFAVFPASSSSDRPTDGKLYDSSSYGNFGDDSFNRSSNKPQRHQSSYSHSDRKSSNMNEYLNYDSPRPATDNKSRDYPSSSSGSKYRDNDNSVDKLLNMLSQSPPNSSPPTPTGRSGSHIFSHDVQKANGAFGSSCSLSRGAGEARDTTRHDTRNESHYARDRRVTPPSKQKTAICDDFDEDDDETRSESKGWRDKSDESKGLESPHSLGSFKRVPTVQRLEDMVNDCLGDSYNSFDNNSAGASPRIREREGSRTFSSSASVDHSARSTPGLGQSLFRGGSTANSKSNSTDNIEGRFSTAPQLSPRGREGGSSRGSFSTKPPSTNYSSSSNDLDRLPSAVSSSSISPMKSVTAKGSSNPAPSMGSLNTGPKARCTRIVLSGSASSRGLRSSVFSKCACDNLRCLSCNFKVHTFVGSTWSTGPAVDYMFFRNNTPNETKLSSQLVRSSEQCAYCCQCSWTHTAAERTLTQGVSGDPQWICAGH